MLLVATRLSDDGLIVSRIPLCVFVRVCVCVKSFCSS